MQDFLDVGIAVSAAIHIGISRDGEGPLGCRQVRPTADFTRAVDDLAVAVADMPDNPGIDGVPIHRAGSGRSQYPAFHFTAGTQHQGFMPNGATGDEVGSTGVSAARCLVVIKIYLGAGNGAAFHLDAGGTGFGVGTGDEHIALGTDDVRAVVGTDGHEVTVRRAGIIKQVVDHHSGNVPFQTWVTVVVVGKKIAYQGDIPGAFTQQQTHGMGAFGMNG